MVRGYAVRTFASQKFSVDCDIVTSKKRLGELEEVLKRGGFTKHTKRTGFDETYAGGFVIHRKEVTVDLLINSLVC